MLGVASALKEINPKVKIVAVEPMESAVLSGGNPGCHRISGIGEGFIPQIVKDNRSLTDEFFESVVIPFLIFYSTNAKIPFTAIRQNGNYILVFFGYLPRC